MVDGKILSAFTVRPATMGNKSVYTDLSSWDVMMGLGVNASRLFTRLIQAIAISQEKDPYLIQIEAMDAQRRDLLMRARIKRTEATRIESHAHELKGTIEELVLEREVRLQINKRRDLVSLLNLKIKNCNFDPDKAWVQTKEVREKLEEYDKEFTRVSFVNHVGRLLVVSE